MTVQPVPLRAKSSNGLPPSAAGAPSHLPDLEILQNCKTAVHLYTTMPPTTICDASTRWTPLHNITINHLLFPVQCPGQYKQNLAFIFLQVKFGAPQFGVVGRSGVNGFIKFWEPLLSLIPKWRATLALV